MHHRLIPQIHHEINLITSSFNTNFLGTQRDLDTVAVVSGWMGSAIEQHQRRIVIKRREDINCKLLTLMQEFVDNTDLFEVVMNEILVSVATKIERKKRIG